MEQSGGVRDAERQRKQQRALSSSPLSSQKVYNKFSGGHKTRKQPNTKLTSLAEGPQLGSSGCADPRSAMSRLL